MILGYCATEKSLTYFCLLVVFNRCHAHFPSTKPPATAFAIRAHTILELQPENELRSGLYMMKRSVQY